MSTINETQAQQIADYARMAGIDISGFDLATEEGQSAALQKMYDSGLNVQSTTPLPPGATPDQIQSQQIMDLSQAIGAPPPAPIATGPPPAPALPVDIYGNPLPQQLVTPTVQPLLTSATTPQQQQDAFNAMNAQLMGSIDPMLSGQTAAQQQAAFDTYGAATTAALAPTMTAAQQQTAFDTYGTSTAAATVPATAASTVGS